MIKMLNLINLRAYNYARNQNLRSITQMKNFLSLTLTAAMLAGCVFSAAACNSSGESPKTPTDVPHEIVAEEPVNYGAESYKKLQYIDKVLSDRDCFNGENFALTQKWIHFTLTEAGYTTDDIKYEEVPISRYVLKDADLTEKFSALLNGLLTQTEWKY